MVQCHINIVLMSITSAKQGLTHGGEQPRKFLEVINFPGGGGGGGGGIHVSPNLPSLGILLHAVISPL